MTPQAHSSHSADTAPSRSASDAEPRALTRGKWRLLFCLLVLGLINTGGCMLSPGQDIPSVTTSGDGEFTTDDPTTGSPVAGSGGASSASGGAPGHGVGGGSGGEPCSDAPGGEGGMAPVIGHIECGGPSE